MLRITKQLLCYALTAFLLVFAAMTSVAEVKSNPAHHKVVLPAGVVPLTWQPTPEHLAIDTDEARALYTRIRRKDFPSLEELKQSPVVAGLDALSAYYRELYGNTADIDTPERLQLREKVKREFLAMGSAVKTAGNQDALGEYSFNGSLAKDYQMVLVMGLPAARKSHQYTNPNSERMQAFILDCDVVKELLPEYQASYGGAADAVHFESFAIMDAAMQEFLTGEMKGTNVILPIVATDLEELTAKYITPFEEAGYNVHAVFMDCTEEYSTGRNVARQLDTGRVFRSEVAFSFGNKPREVYFSLKDKLNAKGEPYGLEVIKSR
ncbi:MAG: zeta toxin family protein [Selenomonadaceae bacterium]|nr:zeta toxin family protein [Selenomonadaceae bacterium]